MDEEENKQYYLNKVTTKLVYMTIIPLLTLSIVFYIKGQVNLGKTYLVIYIFIVGLLGGFVSIQQRLPKIELSELKILSESWVTILLIPINGGIFALVLMMIFMSGFLEGTMFPKYIHPKIDHGELLKSFSSWASSTFPETGRDITKMLFWAFVAGFSERFVPQIIQNKTNEVGIDSTSENKTKK